MYPSNRVALEEIEERLFSGWNVDGLNDLKVSNVEHEVKDWSCVRSATTSATKTIKNLLLP